MSSATENNLLLTPVLCMFKSILGICLQGVSMVRNECAARKAIFLESRHFGSNHPNKGKSWTEGIIWGKLSTSRVAKVTEGLPISPHAPALARSLTVWAGYLISLTPWVWAEQPPLIRTNGKETTQPSPSFIRVKDVVIEQEKTQSKQMNSSGIPCFRWINDMFKG